MTESATAAVRWIRLDPCLVTHVLGAFDAPDGAIVLYVCCYGVPEVGQPVDLSASVVGAAGVGLSGIGGTLGVLEQWRIVGERIERVQVDERSVEYPRMDAHLEGAAFRYGYSLETAWAAIPPTSGPGTGGVEAAPVGLLKFDLARDEIASWSPGPGCTPERAALRPGRRWPRRRRGLAAHRGRRPEPWRKRHLRPGRLCPGSERTRGGDPPAGAIAGAEPWRVGAGRPVSLTGWAVGLVLGALGCLCSSRRHAATVHICMAPTLVKDGPRPASVSRRTEALVSSVAQHHRAISAHQSQLLGAVAELDQRRAWRVDGATSMVAWLVQRCGVSAATAREWVTAAAPPSVAPQDRRCALAGEALLRPGETPRRSGQARDGRKAGRTGDALVRQAGPRTRPGRTEPIRRTVHGCLRPAIPPLRRSTPNPDRDAPRGPVRRRQELAHRPGQPSRP